MPDERPETIDEATHDAPPREGRILRLKEGYNPNSSSIGSQIPVFLFGALAAGGLTVAALHLRQTARRLLRRRRSEDAEQETSTGQ